MGTVEPSKGRAAVLGTMHRNGCFIVGGLPDLPRHVQGARLIVDSSRPLRSWLNREFVSHAVLAYSSFVTHSRVLETDWGNAFMMDWIGTLFGVEQSMLFKCGNPMFLVVSAYRRIAAVGLKTSGGMTWRPTGSPAACPFRCWTS